MKNFFTIIFTLLLGSATAQIFTKTAIFEEDWRQYKVGDTVEACGKFLRTSSTETEECYLIKEPSGSLITVKCLNLKLIDTQNYFWNDVWFNGCGYNYANGAFKSEFYMQQFALARNAYQSYYDQNSIYTDEFLSAYLQQLLYTIYPIKVQKPFPYFVELYLTKGVSEQYSVYDNGTIFLNCKVILDSKTEFDLASILSKCINDIVTSANEFPGLNFNREYMNLYGENFSKNDTAYTRKISPLLRSSAWQAYRDGKYLLASDYNNRLRNFGLAEAEDYYLAILLQKKINFQPETILALIYEARNRCAFNLVEIDKEEVLAYIALNDLGKAKTALENYKLNLLDLKSAGIDVDSQLKDIDNFKRMYGF